MYLYLDVLKESFSLLFSRCVELIIGEQMNKYRARLKDINSLEFAENKAKNRLTLIRRSLVRNPTVGQSMNIIQCMSCLVPPFPHSQCLKHLHMHSHSESISWPQTQDTCFD